jgi:hypothetical protein
MIEDISKLRKEDIIILRLHQNAGNIAAAQFHVVLKRPSFL